MEDKIKLTWDEWVWYILTLLFLPTAAIVLLPFGILAILFNGGCNIHKSNWN